MAGEVWFCSGQSNMEMPVAGWGKIKNYEQEIAAADYPGIRLFQVKKRTSVAPLDAYQVESTMGGWKECSPSTVPEFSAVAYLYARELHQKLNVPSESSTVLGEGLRPKPGLLPNPSNKSWGIKRKSESWKH